MKKLIFLLLTTILFPFNVTSQIKGMVKNKENQPLQYATIALYSLPDSIFKFGAVTDSLGSYCFIKDVLPGDYLLQISFLGYKTKNEKISVTDRSKEVVRDFILDQDENLLNEVIVKGQKPAMKLESGKLTYHIPTLIKNKAATNAYDMLKEIPGVMEQNDQIVLLGTTGVTILLNGHKSTMTYSQLITLLRSTPLSQVEDVEIMYSTPPKYNIRGASINIILKQEVEENTSAPLQGEVAGTFRQRTNASGSGRISLNYNSKQASINALYSYNDSRTFNKEELTAEHNIDNKTYYIEQLSKGNNKYQVHNAHVGFKYQFANNDKVDISYTGMFDRANSKRTATTNISGVETYTNTNSSGPSTMHNTRVDYESHFGLNIGFDYTSYNANCDYFLANSDNASSVIEQLSYKSKQEIRRKGFYANQSHKLKNRWSINYGLSYSYTKSNNSSDAHKDDTKFDKASFDTSQKEDIWNFFAGFSKYFSEKLSLDASLAFEHYKSIERSNNSSNELWDNVAIFPALNLSYMPAENHTFQLAVTSDKSYPSYWSLNPNVYYFSSYGVTYGNPYLKPQRDYNIGLTYIFKRKYLIRSYLNYTPDYFVQLPYQSPKELQQIFMEQNYNYRKSIGLLGSLPFTIGEYISSRFVANIMYMREKDDEFFDLSFDRKAFMGIFQMNHDITLSKKPNIIFNVSGYYSTPTAIQGIYDLGASGNLSTALTFTFDKNRAKLILRGDDIFDTRTPKASIDYKGQKSTLKAFRDTRSFTLSFVYSFGNYKESDRKEVDSSRFGAQ